MPTPGGLPPLSDDKLADMRIAHLNMIQGIISRMSGYSATAKNLCVTVSAAVIAVAFQKPTPLLAAATLLVAGLFLLMDSYYLSLERQYRRYYDEIAKRPMSAAHDMAMGRAKSSLKGVPSAMVSASILPFYTLLALAVGGFLYLAEPARIDVDPQAGRPAAATASAA